MNSTFYKWWSDGYMHSWRVEGKYFAALTRQGYSQTNITNPQNRILISLKEKVRFQLFEEFK